MISECNQCTAFTVDESSDNIYVVEREKQRVRRWIANSNVSVTVAGQDGEGGQSNRHLFYPVKIALDDEETLYVSEDGNGRVVKWKKGALEGSVIASWKPLPIPHWRSRPSDIIVDDNRTIYVIELSRNETQRWFVDSTEGITIAGGYSRSFILNLTVAS